METRGLHHITAIASDAQANLDFYNGVLGLRLVKRTVNFDAPEVYHLYYGDETGRPGTILTFFPFPGASRGRRGSGEAAALAFSVPSGSLPAWAERLGRLGIACAETGTRFGQAVLGFEDPDGLELELIADPSVDELPGWPGGHVDSSIGIRRFHGASISQRTLEPAASFLVKTMGFAAAGVEGPRHRYVAGPEGDRASLDILVEAGASPGRQSAGSVHHLAWRARDEDEQLSWRSALLRAGRNPTEVVDRCYFRSIYFREPGGVLFEIATDPPGFAVDEGLDELGRQLKLPSWLEAERSKLEALLPALSMPSAGGP